MLHREAFCGYDPSKVASFTEKDIQMLEANQSLLLLSGKIRGIVNNAQQILQVYILQSIGIILAWVPCWAPWQKNYYSRLRNNIWLTWKVCFTIFFQIVKEFSSFDKYLWAFFGNKPLAKIYRDTPQVPSKTSKSECVSKDLVKRGFRFVGPSIVYSFMQASGMTNDHLIQCFRQEACKHFYETTIP